MKPEEGEGQGEAAHQQLEQVLKDAGDARSEYDGKLAALLPKLKPLLATLIIRNPPMTVERKQKLVAMLADVLDASQHTFLVRDPETKQYYTCGLRATAGGTAKGYFQFFETKPRSEGTSRLAHQISAIGSAIFDRPEDARDDGLSILLVPKSVAEQLTRTQPQAGKVASRG